MKQTRFLKLNLIGSKISVKFIGHDLSPAIFQSYRIQISLVMKNIVNKVSDFPNLDIHSKLIPVNREIFARISV